MEQARRAVSAADRAGAVAIAILAVGMLVTISGMPSASTAQRPAWAPEVLQPGHCYRIAFSIEGLPNYKVLELLDGGWIKGEVDAGSAKAERQPLWINSAQIVTMREARCSE
jgi:hypothetical protein